MKKFFAILFLLASVAHAEVSVDTSKARASNQTTPVSATVTVSDNTSVDSRVCSWWRSGRFMNANCNITWNGGGAGSTFTVTLPGGATIDTAYLGGGSSVLAKNAANLGWGTWFDNGTAYKMFTVEMSSTTTVSFAVGSVLTGNLFANGDGLKFQLVNVPIVGWR